MKILLVLLLSAASFAQTSIVVGSINKTVFADQYSIGSSTGGIAEAYAACPATGCKVMLGADVAITSSQSLTIADNKPMILDLAGRSITVSNSAGVGLTFTAHDINTRTLSKVENGTLTCAWVASGLTGYKWSAMVGVSIENVNVKNCDHSGTAILWDDVEDSRMDAVQFRSNGLGFQEQNASNQNRFSNVWFDSNVNAAVIQDAGGTTFEDCLVQSNTGTHPFSAITSAGNNATELRIWGCHFENNGDGTSASRAIYIAPATAQSYLNVQIEANTFSRGAFAPGGKAVEFAGSQSIQPVVLKGNQFNGYAAATDAYTGLVNGFRITEIGDNGGSAGCDVCINTATATANISGLFFNPVGSTKQYEIFAGHPSDFQGFLQFWDLTSNASILNYTGTTWHFPKDLETDGAFITTGAVAFTSNVVDFTGSEIVTSGLPVSASDTGTIVSTKNSSASNATQLVIKHNLDAVEFDNQRGGGMIFSQTASGNAVFNSGVEVNSTASKPTCAVGIRGMLWVTQGGAGVKDAVEVCAKDSGDAYAWRTIY